MQNGLAWCCTVHDPAYTRTCGGAGGGCSGSDGDDDNISGDDKWRKWSGCKQYRVRSALKVLESPWISK